METEPGLSGTERATDGPGEGKNFTSAGGPVACRNVFVYRQRSSRTYHSDTLLSWTFLVNEETQDENMVLDEENNVDGQDYEPRNDFDLSMFDENCKVR